MVLWFDGGDCCHFWLILRLDGGGNLDAIFFVQLFDSFDDLGLDWW